MPNKNTVVKRVYLNRQNCHWFEETYPTGSFSGLLDMLLTKFKEAHTVTPVDLANTAVIQTIEELKGK